MKASIKILSIAITLLFCCLIGVALGSAWIAAGLFLLNLVMPYVSPENSLLTVCGAITESILNDCDQPMIGGTTTTVYLFNKADLTSVTRDTYNTQLISVITLSGPNLLFKYEGQKAQNSSVEPEQHLVRGKYSIGYDHQINAKIFSGTSTTKSELEQLAKGLVVAVIENNYRGDDSDGDGAFEIYGLDQGLILTVNDRVLADQDTQGAYSITLKTPDDVKEGHLPATYFITDYATTKAALLAML